MGKFVRRARRRNGRPKRNLKRKRRNGNVFKRRVKRVVNQLAEKKYQDAQYSNNISNAGYFWYFGQTIPQGDSGTTREGNQISMRSIKFTLLAGASQDGTYNETYYRVIVGVWKDYQSTSPSVAKILEAPTDQSKSPYWRTGLQAKTWLPMYDTKFTLSRRAAGNNFPNTKLIDLNFSGKRLPMKRVSYNTTGVPSHTYFVLLVTNYVGVAPPVAEGYSRVTFTDY